MNRLTFLILLTALLGAAPLRAQEASFKVAPPSGKTRLAEVFTVKVEASFPGNYSIRPDTSSIDDSAFELLSFTREGASTSAGAKTETFSVKAQAFALGVSTFPALSWTLYDGKGGETAAQSPSFQLEVLPLFKIRADQDIRDIYPPFRYFPWSWLLAGLLLAAAAAALIYKLRARGGQPPPPLPGRTPGRPTSGRGKGSISSTPRR